MPFTFSHPIAIIPVQRFLGKWSSATALVTGSISPDFEYFFRMKLLSTFSHTLVGGLLFGIPTAMFLSFLYHSIVKDSLIRSLPYPFDRKYAYILRFSWWSFFKRRWLMILFSYLIGIYSHILWDAFTHQNGFFVSLTPLLSQTLVLPYLGELPTFKALQHSSSLIGILLILFILIQHTPPFYAHLKFYSKKNKIRYVTIVLGISLLITVTYWLLNYSSHPSHILIASITATMIAITIASLLDFL